MRSSFLLQTLLTLAVGGSLVVGCSSKEASDAAADDTASKGKEDAVLCNKDSDCDDGIFCNGEELCSPAVGKANIQGCLSQAPPCVAESLCDESNRKCIADCEVIPDADGDSHLAPECGGDDCDDSDARRFPTNTEICDDKNIDEDCDPVTFGFRDQDMDGWPDAQCCNGDNCGTDCDDSVAVIHPTANELCDGLDNNCNDQTDEGVAYGDLPIWYLDADNDGFGLLNAQKAECANSVEGYVRIGGDCDDLDPDILPGAEEKCDGLDNDCNPGTHACWLSSKPTSPYDLPAIGKAGTTEFRFDCSAAGTAITRMFIYSLPAGIVGMNMTCGTLAPTTSQAVSCDFGFVGTEQGTFDLGFLGGNVDASTPGMTWVGFPKNGLAGDCTMEGVPTERTKGYNPLCALPEAGPFEIEGQLTGLLLKNDSDVLSEVGVECRASYMFGDSLKVEMGETRVVGSASPNKIGCPEGDVVVGLHGSWDAEDVLSSLGVICRSIIGVEYP